MTALTGPAVRFNNIQLIRLAGALAVVVTHVSMHAELAGVDASALYSGVLAGLAVPMLFAVSGFILTHVLQTNSLRAYIAARLVRLYPGYWLALLAVIGLMRLRLFTEHHRWLIYFVNSTEVTLWPAGHGQCQYFLGGVEWSLIYEFFLSMALGVLSLLGVRRAMPAAAVVWLAVIAAKIAIAPGFAFDAFPHWSSIALSAYCVPFLLGVLIYSVRDAGRRWLWFAVPMVGGLVRLMASVRHPEWNWCLSGLAAAGAVWIAVKLPSLPTRNILVRAGDWTYGLYLVHVPLMLVVFHAANRFGWSGRIEAVAAAIAVSIGGGFAFGAAESALHSRLRPLVKADVSGRLRRAFARIQRMLGNLIARLPWPVKQSQVGARINPSRGSEP